MKAVRLLAFFIAVVFAVLIYNAMTGCANTRLRTVRELSVHCAGRCAPYRVQGLIPEEPFQAGLCLCSVAEVVP